MKIELETKVEVSHKDWPISLDVTFSYYQNIEPHGEIWREVEILSAIDGTGSNVWDKLSEKQAKYIQAYCEDIAPDLA